MRPYIMLIVLVAMLLAVFQGFAKITSLKSDGDFAIIFFYVLIISAIFTLVTLTYDNRHKR